jgi:phosphohistidine phosphatase
MKTLILLRHAKSSWTDSGMADFDRPLNARGREAAKSVGRRVRAEGPAFDEVLLSPATRATETWDGFVQGFGSAPSPTLEPAIYLASIATLLELIQATDDRISRLLIIGHNPGLERLALMLSQGPEEPRARLAEKFPTAALVEIDLPIDHWSDAAGAKGVMRRFVTPRDQSEDDD